MSFDVLAPHYRWMEAVSAGGLLQRCRTRWLAEARHSRHALLAGEGNGRMLEACAVALPACQFTVLDRSEAMLARAKKRWERSGGHQPVVFQRADLREWRANGLEFDLIVTNFFLDCFNPGELSRVIANISAAASPRSQWLVADFSVPASGWKRLRAQAVLALAYAFFRTATDITANRIVSPDAHLGAAGFVMQQREFSNHGLLHADLWARPAENSGA
jgi:ubiquinone/menaquinone biosynthesis C-methylase UbiE